MKKPKYIKLSDNSLVFNRHNVKGYTTYTNMTGHYSKINLYLDSSQTVLVEYTKVDGKRIFDIDKLHLESIFN